MRIHGKLTALGLALLLLLAGCRGTAPAPSPSPAESSPEVTAPAPVETGAPTPSPEAPVETVQPEAAAKCTVSIECGELLNRLEDLPEEKQALVPSDGILLAQTQVELDEGDSVFDVLHRVCRDAGIHLEFSSGPMADSEYIEGIGNLYEMDCGPLSGWSYTVNGASPNYGCGQYTVAAEDVICWAFHCDLAAPGSE